MNFQLTNDQLTLMEAARRFARQELVEPAAEIESTGEPPSHELLSQFADMGFLGINVSENYGGMGLGNLEAMLILEEIAKISSAVAFPIFESCVGPIRVIERFASESLKQKLIPPVCRGEHIVAVSMSEPQAGTALTDLKTTAKIQGDRVIVNGSKRWCSGGGHSGGYLVYCRLSDAPGAKSIGAVYVDKDTPGLSFGAQEKLMGFRGIPSADIYLDDVELPMDHIVVPAGGFKNLMESFDLERCGNATMALAQATGALEDVIDYVQEREQFGKPIIDFQAVQLRLAEMRIQVDSARLLIQRAVSNTQDGLPGLIEASIAKCHANEIARTVTGNALQLMGGYGYSKEYPMERRLRDAWGWGIAGGTIDIQKVNIASSIVGRRFNQRS